MQTPRPISPNPAIESRLAFSITETAQLLGLSRVSVYRLIERGLLKSNGALRHHLIARSEIERFLAETVVSAA